MFGLVSLVGSFLESGSSGCWDEMCIWILTTWTTGPVVVISCSLSTLAVGDQRILMVLN